MELKQLNFFLAVAEDLHFGRAAERMYIAQPALSQHVRRLERELGVELFDRAGRNVRLTAAGQAFLGEARRVIEQSERAASAARRASDGVTGTLSVGYYPAMAASVAPDMIQAFLETTTDLTVQLSADSPSALEEAVFRGDIDLALTAGPVNRSGLETMRVATSPVAAIALRDHSFAEQRFIEPDDLQDEQLVMAARNADRRLFDSIAAACQQSGFSVRAAHTVESAELVLPAVLCGLGVGLVPTSSVTTFGNDRAVATAVAGIEAIETVLVRRVDRTEPSVLAFWDSASGFVDAVRPLDLTGAAFAGAEGEGAFALPGPDVHSLAGPPNGS